MFTQETVRGLLALIAIGGMIMGLFTGHIQEKSILPFIAMVLQYYFHREQLQSMEKQLAQKDGIISSLSGRDIQVINDPNGQEKNI